MKKVIIGLLASSLLFSAALVTGTQSVQASSENQTEETSDNFIAFMITGNAPVYSPSGMDLKMLAPVSNHTYQVSTQDIIKLADGTLLYPINSENQYVKSTDVTQAVNSDPLSVFKVTPLNEIIHTKNLIGIPLYDETGNIIERRALAADSYWYANGKKENLQTGEIFYRVSTHEYVSSVDIL